MRVVSSIDRLEYIGPVKSKPPISSHRITTNVSNALSEVNLIGLQVDEALEQVEKVIDKAVISGQKHLELVHGVGTGALKQAIQERLKKHSFVESFSHPDVRRGGVGVTSVELKG